MENFDLQDLIATVSLRNLSEFILFFPSSPTEEQKRELKQAGIQYYTLENSPFGYSSDVIYLMPKERDEDVVQIRFGC
ncbi:MAG TPA: hypothetical protein DCW90_05330 [Lachnospiraceae bacterium]|nr:hypothetical protein [Lachnospiraceae bacterium]